MIWDPKISNVDLSICADRVGADVKVYIIHTTRSTEVLLDDRETDPDRLRTEDDTLGHTKGLI